MVSFLGANGYDVVALMDFEDGVTISNLLAFNVETGRQLLTKEKALVNGVAVALGSLFDQKLLGKFNTTIDNALAASEHFVRSGEISKEMLEKGESRKTFGSKADATQHTVKELNKLNLLLSM